MSFASLLSCNICWNRERILPSLDFKPVNTRESISDFEHGVAADPDEPTCISKVVVVGFTTAGEGRKRSLEEQKAASAGDWLNPK